MTQAEMQSYILKRYDEICALEELRRYYGGSDYLNFGYWRDDTPDQLAACETLMEELLASIPSKDGNILDVACGKGATTAYLLKTYSPGNVTAINISPTQLQIARENAPGCTFRLMDAVSLDFDDASFDNVICVEAVFHFHTRDRFLREAHRVLRPGGRLVLSDVLMTREGEERRSSRTTANYVESLDAYRDSYLKAGFADVDVRDVTEECWRRHYRYAVSYFHEKLLRREITLQQLSDYLVHTYGRVPDIRYYLLAVAGKDVDAVSKTRTDRHSSSAAARRSI